MRGLDMPIRMRGSRRTRGIGSLVRGNHRDTVSGLDSSFNKGVCKVLSPLSPGYCVRRVATPAC